MLSNKPVFSIPVDNFFSFLQTIIVPLICYCQGQGKGELIPVAEATWIMLPCTGMHILVCVLLKAMQCRGTISALECYIIFMGQKGICFPTSTPTPNYPLQTVSNLVLWGPNCGKDGQILQGQNCSNIGPSATA